jgi:hypothetical protein
MLMLSAHRPEIRQQVFYIGDYPEHSIQHWANLIQENMGTRRISTLPAALLKGIAKVGDGLKKLGYPDFPLTSFRLNNMLTGSHYPLEKTETVIGDLPFSLEKSVRETIVWMKEQNEIKHGIG